MVVQPGLSHDHVPRTLEWNDILTAVDAAHISHLHRMKTSTYLLYALLAPLLLANVSVSEYSINSEINCTSPLPIISLVLIIIPCHIFPSGAM